MGWFGPRPRGVVVYGPLTTAANDVVVTDFFVEAGTQGIIVDVYHEGTTSVVTYSIQGYHYTGGASGWTQSYTTLLTSAAIAVGTGTRLVVDPRVTAVTNTHAQTVLPYRIRIRANADTANTTGLWLSVTEVS